jgi:hypothetical protein
MRVFIPCKFTTFQGISLGIICSNFTRIDQDDAISTAWYYAAMARRFDHIGTGQDAVGDVHLKSTSGDADG